MEVLESFVVYVGMGVITVGAICFFLYFIYNLLRLIYEAVQELGWWSLLTFPSLYILWMIGKFVLERMAS